MTSQEQNELLTRVERGTPCGELMRRYWQPVARMEELPQHAPDGRLPGLQRAVQESLGPISDRTKEHLGASHAAVVRLRDTMLKSVRGFMEGEDPPRLDPPIAFDQIRSHHKMLPVDVPWHQIDEYEGEDIEAGYARAVASEQ